jgi:hypothetical protein
VCLEVLAEQCLTPTAVEALATELRVVCTDSLANLEVLYILTDRSYYTDGLVARNKRELDQTSVSIGSIGTA